MIQVCSQCGTRWNVRDRQRTWCPRCNGTLLAPGAGAPPAPPSSPWSARAATASAAPAAPASTSPRLPPGYRWIAVRPGAAPPPRSRHRDRGPVPRYTTIPRWGLVEDFDRPPPEVTATAGPSPAMLRATLIPSMMILAAAAFAHLIRYVLLLINRDVLLHPWIAAVATWLPVGLSVAAIFAVVISVVVLMNWLIARRAEAFAQHGLADPRPGWLLRVGCLVPLANLVLAPVFVFELAKAEDRLTWARTPLIAWWIVWLASYVASTLSVVTSFFAREPQSIADNTVATTIAYLLALAALVLAMRVYLGFDRTPVDRPSKRWVVAPDGAAEQQRGRRRDEDPEDTPEPAREPELAW